MNDKLFNRNILVATLGTAALGLSMGSASVFAATDLNQGYEVQSSFLQVAEGQCGEGRCGGTAPAKAAEGSCGEGSCGGTESKAAEGSCGEGSCGGAEQTTDKDAEGKCGEGRCGG